MRNKPGWTNRKATRVIYIMSIFWGGLLLPIPISYLLDFIGSGTINQNMPLWGRWLHGSISGVILGYGGFLILPIIIAFAIDFFQFILEKIKSLFDWLNGD